METEIKTKPEIINWLRLSAMLNIVLFILPGSIAINMTAKMVLTLFSSNYWMALTGLILIINPFNIILFMSFILSIKYFITKESSEFANTFLKISVFINFFTNLVVIISRSLIITSK